MKKTYLAMATLLFTMTGAALAFDTPTWCQGTGRQQGQTGNQKKGKQLGPKDGSGPIHTPGTGGGTGAGQRRGRR